MVDLFPPPSEMVAVAWLKAVLAPFTAIGNTVPATGSWPDGFVQALVVGGTPLMDVPVRKPVLSVDVWAANTNSSNRPPWGRASVLVERVRLATEGVFARPVELPTGYRPAYVSSVFLRTEPRRIPNDAGAFAHFSMDVELHWREAS